MKHTDLETMRRASSPCRQADGFEVSWVRRNLPWRAAAQALFSTLP
ncbi:hypothetical protein [Uliginosibacterium sp. H1]|nr:hypothetical protein [Uliginosibacterium sp. H1]